MTIEETVYNAYKSCHTDVLVGSKYLVIIIALIYVLRKIYLILKENLGDSSKRNIKAIFSLIDLYVFIAVFIIIFPLVLPNVEKICNVLCSELGGHYHSTLNISVTDISNSFVKDYLDQASQNFQDKGFFSKLKGLAEVEYIAEIFFLPFAMLFKLILVFILKYIYFFFLGARYLWLLMLEVVSPLAIVCYLDEKLRNHFHTWLKNMYLCYLLLPCLKIADVFTEELMTNLFGTGGLAEFNILFVLVAVVVKLTLFGVVTKKITQLI